MQYVRLIQTQIQINTYKMPTLMQRISFQNKHASLAFVCQPCVTISGYVLNMYTDSIDTKNFKKVLLHVPFPAFSVLMRAFLAFLKYLLACGKLEEEEIEEKNKGSDAVHSSREVFL